MQLYIVGLIAASLGWIVQAWIGRRKRLRIEAQMTRELEERYQAYVELEDRINRAIAQFDAHERELTQTLAVQSANIERLRAALNQHEGIPTTYSPPMHWPVEPRSILPSPPPPAIRTSAEEDLAEWEKKLDAVREEKRAEIASQSSTIADLTRRLEALTPMTQTLGAREAEVETWKRAHLELGTWSQSEIELLRRKIAELEPYVRALAEAEERGRAWEEWCHTVEQEKVEEIASLRTRVDELDGVEEKLKTTKSQLGTTETKLDEMESKLDHAEARLDEMEGEIEASRSKLQEREKEIESLRKRCSEIEESGRKDAAVHVQRIANLESVAGEVERLRQENAAVEAKLDDRRHEVVAMRERAERDQAELAKREIEMTSLRDELNGKVEALAKAMHANSAVDEGRRALETRAQASEILVREREREIATLSTRIRELERAIADSQTMTAKERERVQLLSKTIADSEREIKNHRSAIAAQDAAFQAAKDMLAELVPMVEGLQSQLERREVPSGL